MAGEVTVEEERGVVMVVAVMVVVGMAEEARAEVQVELGAETQERRSQ